jgi:hypothetical protein
LRKRDYIGFEIRPRDIPPVLREVLPRKVLTTHFDRLELHCKSEVHSSIHGFWRSLASFFVPGKCVEAIFFPWDILPPTGIAGDDALPTAVICRHGR